MLSLTLCKGVTNAAMKGIACVHFVFSLSPMVHGCVGVRTVLGECLEHEIDRLSVDNRCRMKNFAGQNACRNHEK